MLKKVNVAKSCGVVKDCDRMIDPSHGPEHASTSSGAVCRPIDVGALVENPVKNISAVNHIPIGLLVVDQHGLRGLLQDQISFLFEVKSMFGEELHFFQ